MDELTHVASQVAVALAKDLYKDVAAGAAKQIGNVLTDVAKGMRLASAPFQYAGMIQERLEIHLKKSLEKVPPERLISPVESMAHQLFERLRYEPTESELSELYRNLLARAMDKDRVGEAHPAFLMVISQLSSDEVKLIEQLALRKTAIFGRLKGERRKVLKNEELTAHALHWSFPAQANAQLGASGILPEELIYPENTQTYIDHLQSLSLLSYTNEPDLLHGLSTLRGQRRDVNFEFWFIELSGFGSLFHTACIEGS